MLVHRGDMESQTNVPVMMTFKQFLNAQEDNIDDMEAVRKYQEYKLEFKKTQMADFFMRHKEEEWYAFCSKQLLGSSLFITLS